MGNQQLLDPSVFPSFLAPVGWWIPRCHGAGCNHAGAVSDTLVPVAGTKIFKPILNTSASQVYYRHFSYASMLQQLADQVRAKSCLVVTSKEAIAFCRKPR